MKRLRTKCLLRLLRHLFTSLDRGRQSPPDRLVDLDIVAVVPNFERSPYYKEGPHRPYLQLL